MNGFKLRFKKPARRRNSRLAPNGSFQANASVVPNDSIWSGKTAKLPARPSGGRDKECSFKARFSHRQIRSRPAGRKPFVKLPTTNGAYAGFHSRGHRFGMSAS